MMRRQPLKAKIPFSAGEDLIHDINNIGRLVFYLPVHVRQGCIGTILGMTQVLYSVMFSIQ